MSTDVAIARPRSLKAGRMFSTTLVPRNKLPKTKAVTGLPPILELEEPEPGEDESPALPVFQDICNNPSERSCTTVVFARAPKEPLRLPVRKMLTRSSSNKQITPTVEFTSLCLTEERAPPHAPPRASAIPIHPGTTDKSERIAGNQVMPVDGPIPPQSRKRQRDNEEHKDPKRRRIDLNPEMPRVVRRRSERQKAAEHTRARRGDVEARVELPRTPMLPVKVVARPTARKRSFGEIEQGPEDADADAARYPKRRLSTALLDIPTEIWLEIVSDSNFLILQSEKDGIPRSLLLLSRSTIPSCPKTIPSAYRGRPETLRALSQSCRALRSVFLPLLWERVEACFEPKDGTAWYARVANVLLARCRGLMKPENRSIAHHVRVVSVSLSWHRIDVVMPLFAQCLESLLNLDTLHILHLKSKSEKTVTAAFEDVELPGLRTIILPSYAHGILAACPNVRDVSCNEETGAILFKTLIDCCPNVERIQGFELNSTKLKKLAKGLPKLREIAVPYDMDINSLSVFKGLSVIELIGRMWDYVEESDFDEEDFSPSTARKRKTLQTKRQRTDAARAVLKASAGKGPKRVKVSYWESITGMVGMTDITYGKYWVSSEVFDV
ncbi:hypothetical protein B0H17DRAFT_1210199 [Mycena rosella]|uniref:F-box domain-containing protein n=1 Tax=Mycena rosella TaxID=1033263 RepID=A0AAD7G4T8_MYCRO|nr:hypothetical protein B0H17DRAFT_1210199 [Mycena rosella]